jgi:hypothetical protein
MTKRKEILKHLIPFPLIALFGISPILIAMFAGFIASLFGHQLNEGSAPDIPLIGDLLYAMGVMGWFSLLTLPVAGFGLLIYCEAVGLIPSRLRRIKNSFNID